MAPSAAAETVPAGLSAESSTARETIEERCFSAALICLEGHYADSPPMGPLTSAKVTSIVTRTLHKTHTFKDVRESLSRNVAIWIWLTRIFAAAIPSLTTRSVGPLSSLNDPDKGVTPQESTALIIKNYPSLKDDLLILNNLMLVARNLLVTSDPEVPQDLCAAVHLDQMVYQTVILCVNVTSKGYDGEILDDSSRVKLNEVTELYKKLLVTSLQQAHNWTAKNDRNKMSFWFDVLFDDDDVMLDDPQDPGDGFRVDVAKTEVQHWLERNSAMCDAARHLLKDYVEHHAHEPPGPLAPISPLAWNWLPQGSVKIRADDPRDRSQVESVWREDEKDKFEQDKTYARVSHEVDRWWEEQARDENYDDYAVEVPSVEYAQSRIESCKASYSNKYSHSFRPEDQGQPGEDFSRQEWGQDPDPNAARNFVQEYVDDMIEEGEEEEIEDDDEEDDDDDDDESYGEGPMTGLLTEVPNILDPKQIEALHMIVKSCICDTVGSGLARSGENLQETRCKMFLALDCGKSLLREILVFIAVWEKDEQSMIFEITTQIVRALHHNALVPYAWNCLRIPKDIISPAQTVLLRLVHHMFRSFWGLPVTPEVKLDKMHADIKVVHFFFRAFRSQIVPECVALMNLQAQIRGDLCDPADFPVDNWDMERARDGLVQFLDFLSGVAEVGVFRKLLIDWEAAYELIVLLRSLEEGVEKKPLVSLPKRSDNRPTEHATTAASASPIVERPYATDGESSVQGDQHHHHQQQQQQQHHPPPPPPPPPPPLQEPAHKFPWAGVKGQILHILASLLQPPPGKTRPGDKRVQEQIVRHNGIVPILNCSVYDDHNRFARERVDLCLKWLLDDCQDARDFIDRLVRVNGRGGAVAEQGDDVHAAPLVPAAAGRPGRILDAAGPDQPPPIQSLRIDGVEGHVDVRVRPRQPGSSAAGPGIGQGAASALSAIDAAAAVGIPARTASGGLGQLGGRLIQGPAVPPPPPRVQQDVLREFAGLAGDAAARAAQQHQQQQRRDGDETEEDDFM